LNKSCKKKEISYDDLPQGTKIFFRRKVIPLALDTASALKLWNTPSDDAIVEVWNMVFGDDYPIVEGDIDCHRFVVAKTLMSALFVTDMVSKRPSRSNVRYQVGSTNLPIQLKRQLLRNSPGKV
jgi:hypothetical protein